MGGYTDHLMKAGMAGLASTCPDAAASSRPATLCGRGIPDNPLGARAMYLGSTLYRSGSNEPETIGEAVSSGCIRMLNEDVVDLYDCVKVGTRVAAVVTW